MAVGYDGFLFEECNDGFLFEECNVDPMVSILTTKFIMTKQQFSTPNPAQLLLTPRFVVGILFKDTCGSFYGCVGPDS